MVNKLNGERDGSSCLWQESDERHLRSIYYRNIFCSKKYMQHVSSPQGYPWTAGCGIIRPPISLMSYPKPQKDVSYVAPPACHRACA
jgi:hypothetical protein